MRKVAIVPVPPGYGRDSAKGKVFRINEWPARRAEEWAWRMGLCLKGTSVYIPDETLKLGIIGITNRMINGVLAADVNPDVFVDLLNQMFECVQIVRVATTPDPMRPEYPLGDAPTLEDDIEEPQTIGWLRLEVLKLHTNFDWAEGLSRWLSAVTSMPEAS